MKIGILFFLLFVVKISFSQQIISLNTAIDDALKNNFGILVARNNADVAKINNSLGNAGMLPTLVLNGDASISGSNIHQEYIGGIENNFNPQNTTSFDFGPQLSWTIFDGGKMFVSKNKLIEIQNLSELQYKAKILATVYNVTEAYYNIVRQNQQLKSYNEIINYNIERVKISEAGMIAGKLAKTDLLQAQIDLNIAKEAAINQQSTIEIAKKQLNEWIGKGTDISYQVEDSIKTNFDFNKEKILQKLLESNIDIQSYNKQLEINKLIIKENSKSFYPQLDLKAAYLYNQMTNSTGNLLYSRSIGPYIGGSLSIPLYTGGDNKRKLDIARLEAKSSEINLQNVKLQTNIEIQNAILDFETNQKLLLIEKENNILTKDNLELSMKRLEHGEATTLEVHWAQQEYIQSCTRLINFEYNLKIAETKIKQLLSEL